MGITGKRFGKLVAVKKQGVEWLCLCDCGKESSPREYDLVKGLCNSCGCSRTKHGLSGHELYNTWKRMRDRCLNKNGDAYKNYGGRGIKICPPWDDFSVFVSDMGSRPKGTSLDRKDNDGDYSPENCKWPTRKEQACNRRGGLFLEGVPLTVWCEEHNASYYTTKWRVNNGWSAERIKNTDPKEYHHG